MRWAAIAGWCLVSLGGSGCLFGDCPDTVRGFKEGDQVTTLLGESFADATTSTTPSCGKLGDLDPGTTLSWTAHLRGPGDDCEDTVAVHLKSVSSGTLATGPIIEVATLTLPGGCSGTWTISLRVLDFGADLTEAPPDPQHPSWVVERSFDVTSDPTLCWPDMAPPRCSDRFLAENSKP